jgi:hypothetical protein
MWYQLIVGHRHHGPSRDVADQRGDLLDADRQGADEDDLVDRDLHAEPAPSEGQVPGEPVGPIGGQSGVELGDPLRVERRLDRHLTGKPGGLHSRLGQRELLGRHLGVALGGLDGQLALQAGLRRSCPGQLELGVCSGPGRLRLPRPRRRSRRTAPGRART